jgi:hypothetical protein
MPVNLIRSWSSRIIKFIISNILFLNLNSLYAQKNNLGDYKIYNNTYDTLNKILIENKSQSFVKSVFLVENAYLSNNLDFNKFYSYINDAISLIKVWQSENSIGNYYYTDSFNLSKNYGVYVFLKDTIKVVYQGKEYSHLPYTYDFNDFFGYQDWSNMFVTKLLATHKGNCHSLPYLYKILADELGATCWLSLAPNHMYIKNRCKKTGWYNTELTSGEFPIDAWIATSGYVPIDAIRSGIYMDTLSNQQAIALCVLDLAKGYEHQTKNYEDGFILKCCDLVLQYHPVNVQAILLKAETLKHIYEKQQLAKDDKATATYSQMEELYTQLFTLGYREMPEKMYMQWLRSVTQQRNKYGNKALKATLNKR